MIGYDTGSAEHGQDHSRRQIDLRLVLIGAAAIAVAIALGIGLALGLGASRSPVSARSIVSGDGYKVTQTLTPAQVHASMAADTSQDGQTAASMIEGDAAAGVKPDGSKEAAVGLTENGRDLVNAFMPLIKSSGFQVRVDDGYLVVSGSAKQWAENGDNPFANLGG